MLRGINADINILMEGERIIGVRSTEYTLMENPTVDDKLSNEVLKSSGRLKQEVNNEQTSLFKI